MLSLSEERRPFLEINPEVEQVCTGLYRRDHVRCTIFKHLKKRCTITLSKKCKRWMEVLQFYVYFNINSVISGRTKELYLRLKRTPPLAETRTRETARPAGQRLIH